MKLELTYLLSAILTGLFSILCNHACLCDVNFSPDNNQLVKSDDVGIENDGIDAAGDKRAWDKNFAVWGKRDWENFHSWGKRDDGLGKLSFTLQPLEKRKWAKFTSWGKRDSDLLDDIDLDVDGEKRSAEIMDEPLVVDKLWPNYALWHGQPLDDDVNKRKWSNLAVWGKRAADSTLDDLVKKWAKFTSWGKRNDDMNTMDKRKWSQFASWGKRGIVDDVMDDVEKRKWSTPAAWGKRDLDDYNGIDKRKWSKFASWGKRLRSPQAWLALKNGGKRRWSGLTTWGKR